MDPIEPKYHDTMNEVAKALDQVFKGCGWTLLVFDWGDKGRMNYISNAQRQDMIACMKEFIAKDEGRHHEAPETKQ